VRVSRTLPSARLRRASLVSLFALTFALIPAAPAPAEEAAGTAARAHLEKGRALTTRREYDQALAELDQALLLTADGADLRLAGQIQAARGQAFYWKHDWPRMKEAYETAADLFDRAGAFRDEALAWRGLILSAALSWKEKERIIVHAADVLRRDPDPEVEGLVLHRWGEILVNQGYYGRGLEKLELALVKLAGSTDENARARLLTSLGRARRLHGQPDAALPYYDQALRIQMRIGDLAGAAQSENAIAIAMSYTNWTSALAHSARALALAQLSGSAPMIAFNRIELGEFLSDTGDDQHALPLLAIADPALSPIDAPNRLLTLSRIERNLGKAQESLTHAEEGMAAELSFGDPFRLVFALANRAESHAALGHPDEALRDVREAVALLEKMRSALTAEDQARQGFADSYPRVFSTAISLLVQNGHGLEALEVAEKARARAFLDLLTTRDLAPSASDAARDAQRQTLVDAAPVSGEAMRATVTRLGSTLLAYWVQYDNVFVWVMTPDGTVQARRLPVTTKRLRELTTELGAPAPAHADGDPARALYDYLVKPVEEWLPSRIGSRLTIVPQGPLFALPFAALRDGQGRYLVERWATHYATSMSVLDRLESRLTGKHAGVLVVAEPTLDASLRQREGLAPLPAARAEAAAVVQRVAGPATSLTGAAATPDAVRQAAESRRVVHFATHAVVSDTRPLESFLALAPGEASDGRLTSADIYGWHLDADLVVLSACRTARGRVNGDGVIGLSRAFAYAGTPSLIASVWDTPDQTSRELFPTFYAEWQRTGDRAGALRAAQLALIRKLRAGGVTVTTPAGPATLQERPAMWAPFVLLGEP
jgi:CHAT domain-containing protein